MRSPFLFVLVSFALGVSSANADIADSVRRLRDQSVLLIGSDAKALLAQEWTKYDPRTLERREQALRRIRALGKRLADDQNAGRSRECSTQIFLEAKWRAIYTADFQAIERRIRDLEASLGDDNQAYVARQSPVDGSWGACFEPMFMKLEATTLRLQELHKKDTAPDYAISLLPDIRTTQDALALLMPLLVSDIARDGIDHRSELNGLSDSYLQLGFKAYWQTYLEDQVEGLLRDRDTGGIGQIRADVRQFLDAWQDPVTGYWGAWYRVGNRLYRTADLSITFHLISYLQGDVHYWPQIIETTFNIANEPYPYGWRYGLSSNNHNNYDVVKIFRYGWPHMTEEQRARARDAMREMLRWALDHSLQPDGSFAPDESFFSSVPSDYYFGVSFFDEIGYWRATKRFWTDEAFQGADANCRLIRGRLAALQLTGPIALSAEQKLEASCGTP
ncbi:MAG: hypothetical protein ABWY13_15520 [Mesorhizobium sp.]|jgi:hypothetical protein